MTLTWHDLAAGGAPPVTMALTTTYGKRAPAKKKRAPAKPAAIEPQDATPAPPPFMFPGAVDILNAMPPSYDDNKENEYDSEDEQDDEANDELVQELAAKFDCDAVRRKIQRFLARKTMTQTAFLRAINVNPNSYRNFMAQKGKFMGENNGTYDGALVFFHKLEKKEGAAVTSKGAAKPKGAAADAKGPRKEQNAKIQELFDKINAVTLAEPVYVYDDCDEVRWKINELIESKTVTQAALLRELDVNSNSLRRFLTTTGKRQGCSNGVYLKAYCFFEKLRIAENTPRSTKRVKTENELPEGYSLERDPNGVWCYMGVPIQEQIRNGTLAPIIDELRNRSAAARMELIRNGTVERMVDQMANGTLEPEFLFS